ncbi:MAG: 4'-phosphopantetheinyl [Geobacteraceae bacterium]|nr:MAG: 4'-phosphopantetheinyl [Geobacteraceae bacterium]
MNRVPTPAAGEVHIRFIHLDREPGELARLERFLSPDERIRAGRLRDRQARDRFVAGRGFLRETLAGCLGREPERLRLAVGEHGKPSLAGEEGSKGLRFSLSHAEDLAILAVARDCEIGVDLERMRDNVPFRQMAQRFFSPRERDELFTLPPPLQLPAFFRCWTRKEAYLKGCGTGFSQPSDCFAVTLLPGHPPALMEHLTSPGEPARWRIVDIAVPDGCCAALAAEGETPVIRCFPWDLYSSSS